MIDPHTGDLVTADGLPIGPETTREGFEASAVGRSSEVSVRNEPWCSYALPLLHMEGRTFGATIYFYGEEAESISLTIADPAFGSSWEDWSDENERRRHIAHEEWLAETIGAERDFSWGIVWAGRDAKTTDAHMIIRYAGRYPGSR